MDRRDDTPRLDHQADRMEDQEQRLAQDVPPRSLGGGGGPLPAPGPATPRLDRVADEMEAQERRLDRDEPPTSLVSEAPGLESEAASPGS